jgi:alpha-ketoglutaric semialdehyde dehydrogenase
MAIQQFGLFIDGTEIKTKDYRPNINPSDTTDIVGNFSQGTQESAIAAARAARAAAQSWADTPIQNRADILDAAGSMILQRQVELGRLLAREEGKTLAEAQGEAARAGRIFKFFAGEALRLQGEFGDSVRAGVDVIVRREPVGTVALITPWNFPIAIPAWKLAPALAFGNTVVLKPAELTPACAWEMVSILNQCGLPKGVVNLVTGPGSVIGTSLIESGDIDAVSFTGSQTVGRAIAARCAALGKRVQTEMGGKNPWLVLADADLATAVECAINAAFYSTGQRCTASSRLIVVDEIHDVFVERLNKRMTELVVGNALDPKTHIGPVVDETQLKTNLRYLDIAKQEGATVCGGAVLKGQTPGYYLQPALLTDTTSQMRINREEIFGPIASIIRATDYEHGLALANDTEFGLSAGICTTSLKYARDFMRRSRCGMVMVNLPTAGVDYHVPFGGTKGSSFGPREQGTTARDFYSAVKTCYVG